MSQVFDLGTATIASFLPHVGTEFASEIVALNLIEASALRSGQSHPEARPPFRLLFRGPAPMLPQGIHALAHPALGQLALFIVPIAGNEGGFTYEAIFN